MYLLLAAAALAVSSCQKDAGGGGKSPTDPVGTIPADFDWENNSGRISNGLRLRLWKAGLLPIP